jgi:hypothetical protein
MTKCCNWFFIGLALVAAIGCESPPPDGPAARRDFAAFRMTVYPVLLRDCGFPACHGAAGRLLRVWGPGRTRLPGISSTPEAFDLPTGDELSASYSLALSFIDDGDPTRSDLLRKPLAIEAGGVSHAGVDQYGRNVYRTSQDQGLQALLAWVSSVPE